MATIKTISSLKVGEVTLRVGNMVKVLDGFSAASPHITDGEGEIIAIIPGGVIGVEFENAVPGFGSCGGRGKDGHCAWGSATAVAVLSDKAKRAKPSPEDEKKAEEQASSAEEHLKEFGYTQGREVELWNDIVSLLKSPNVHRHLLYGPPGTGKSTMAVMAAGDRPVYSITIHADTQVADIIGHWVPKGGEFYWHHGVGIRAWLEGAMLVINEIVDGGSPVQTALHALLDDKSIAAITLPNGETVRPHKDFTVIATTNGMPDELADALFDRFDTCSLVDTPSTAAIRSLPRDLRQLCVNSYSNPNELTATFRHIRSFGLLRESDGVSVELAGSRAFGKAWSDVKAAIALNSK